MVVKLVNEETCYLPRCLSNKTASWLFESIPLIYRVVKLSNCLRIPFGDVINVLGKLFCTINHENDR